MQVLGSWNPDRAANLPLDMQSVQFVLSSCLTSILIQLGLGIAATIGVYWIADSSTGPAAAIVHFLAVLFFFYVIFAGAGLYGHLKARKNVMRDAAYFIERGDTDAATFWRIHRDAFPPPWK